MSRKQKYTCEQKVKACEDYKNGRCSAAQIAHDLSMGLNGAGTVLDWIKEYEAHGPAVFLPAHHNQTYTKELKEEAVQAYLNGKGSLDSITIKYGLKANTQLRSWIKKYTGLEELKDYHPQPEVYIMASRKKTTKAERIEIVQYCLEHNKDYKGTAAKYECSYSQVFDWMRKYLSSGEDGLNDKRGVHKADNELDEMEKLKRQLRLSERRNEELQMENELLKKLQEVEGRRYSPKDDSHRNS